MIPSFICVFLQLLLQDREKDLKALEKAKKEIDCLREESENHRKDSENAAQQVMQLYLCMYIWSNVYYVLKQWKFHFWLQDDQQSQLN